MRNEGKPVPKLGQTFYAVNRLCTNGEKGITVTVVKVGQKYFYTALSPLDPESKWLKFDKQSWKNIDPYNPNFYRLYSTKDECIAQIRTRAHRNAVISYLSTPDRIPDPIIEKIYELLCENGCIRSSEKE